MRRAKRRLAVFSLVMMVFLVMGVGNLVRYSEHVRFVHLLGISASGANIAVGLVGIILCCLVFTGKLRLAQRPPAEEQPRVPEPPTHRSQS